MSEEVAIQQRWARVVGLSYLFAIPPAVFAEFYVLDRLVSTDGAATMQKIVAHQQLFRVGIASNLSVCLIDIVLATSLYIVLEQVNRRLSLLALLFRVTETILLFVAVLNDFSALRLTSGADYLAGMGSDQLATLARLSIALHNSVYGVALLVFGFGSTIFCYLWLKSGYVPRPLALWGLLASIWVGVCSFAFVVFPELGRVINVGYYGGPIFLFELTMGFWLAIKSIRIPLTPVIVPA